MPSDERDVIALRNQLRRAKQECLKLGWKVHNLTKERDELRQVVANLLSQNEALELALREMDAHTTEPIT